MLQQEDQTLEQLYRPESLVRPSATKSASSMPKVLSTRLQELHTDLEEKKRIMPASMRSALAFEEVEHEVEQEREVEFEVEQVREKQRPSDLKARGFPGLDASIKRFASTGTLEDKDPSHIQAFALIGETWIGAKFGVKETKSRLFCSREFQHTVIADKAHTEKGITVSIFHTLPIPASPSSHSFQRPVEWILWCENTATALVVIPEEAELLISMLRNQDSPPRVWLLSYSAPVTRSMCKFNALKYLTIPDMPKNITLPSWLVIEIGVLGGRLYFEWPEYQGILTWLGVAKEKRGPAGLGIRHPRKFLLEWLTHCRQTHDVTHTPMGYICNKRPLKNSHSFFQSADGPPAVGDAPVGAVATDPSSSTANSSSTSADSSEEDAPWVGVGVGAAVEDGSDGSESMDLAMDDDIE